MTRPAPTFEVPAGTPVAHCDGCPAVVYWIRTKKGKPMLVDCHAGAGCEPPTETAPGFGVSHFATCSAADRFRKPRTVKPHAAS